MKGKFLKAIYSVLALSCIVGLGLSSETPGGGDGATATCNCDYENDLTGATVSHSAKVRVYVRVDGESEYAGTFDTDLTGDAASNQTIAPGECHYVRYSYICVPVLFLYECELPTSFTIAKRSVGFGDCQ